jgi:hypothetical protein
MEIIDFYKDFMQDVYSEAIAGEDFREEVFIDMMCANLEEMGVISGYDTSKFQRDVAGLRLDAWFYDETSQELFLFVGEFNSSDIPQSLTKSQIEKIFKRAERFFERSLEEKFYRSLDESDPGYEVSYEIFYKQNVIRKVRLFLLSNGLLSKTAGAFESKLNGNVTYTYDVWEIGRLARLKASGKSKEDVQIDVTDYLANGIKALKAYTGSETCKSYLLVAPGEFIAKIYDEYGDRLLEQNVRTFLQFRGKINKRIRNTIRNQPDMFFAYNNGLTATAEEVVLNSDSEITSIKNLQIVNGGQTTAAIFNSKLKEKNVDLSKVFVQVKLSVISTDEIDDVVPKISQFANTQNKVSAADFFSNHPFHLRIEEFSRRIWAPSREGSFVETHWFYERARGQFGNAQSKLTPARRKAFLEQNPKKQMITKTDLAKYINCFKMRPHIVSKGAQFNFSQFAEEMGKEWAKSETAINKLYFKELISKAIIFKSLDSLIMKQDWYGGYKANIVAYSLSYLSHELKEKKLDIDFELVWKKQSISEKLINELLTLAKAVNGTITDTSENVTQFCKKERCWDKVKQLNHSIEFTDTQELISHSKSYSRKAEAKKTQGQVNKINKEIYVVGKGDVYWRKLAQWALSQKILSEREMSILTSACDMSRKIPTARQAKVICDIEKKAIEEGFYINE